MGMDLFFFYQKDFCHQFVIQTHLKLIKMLANCIFTVTVISKLPDLVHRSAEITSHNRTLMKVFNSNSKMVKTRIAIKAIKRADDKQNGFQHFKSWFFRGREKTLSFVSQEVFNKDISKRTWPTHRVSKLRSAVTINYVSSPNIFGHTDLDHHWRHRRNCLE